MAQWILNTDGNFLNLERVDRILVIQDLTSVHIQARTAEGQNEECMEVPVKEGETAEQLAKALRRQIAESLDRGSFVDLERAVRGVRLAQAVAEAKVY